MDIAIDLTTARAAVQLSDAQYGLAARLLRSESGTIQEIGRRTATAAAETAERAIEKLTERLDLYA